VDINYYQKQISCQNACPVRTDARGYIQAVTAGDYEDGYVRAREPNPFASTCGRVCAAHCEKACRRGKIDAPITIRALKRFLCETYGVEAKSHLPITRDMGKGAGIELLRKAPRNAATVQSFGQLSLGGKREISKDTRVAVIGAGPAGLTAAHDLALLGYRVTVFEATPDAGGMTILGIPEYRLPRNLLKAEIGEIRDLGVEVKFNTRLGKGITLPDLRQQFKAIFIAIGAHKDRGLDIEGVHLDGVLAAVDFLLNVNLGYRVNLGDKVAVLGGGDVAVDAARVAARLGEVYDLLAAENLVTAVDAARHALRLGARDVHMVYRGAREEMRASQEELEGALEEGITIHTGLMPKRIMGSGDKVTGLEVLSTRSIYDERGRRNLVPVEGSESLIECSSVILAIGQESDLSFIGPEDGIAVSKQRTIIANDETLATTASGVFAGGDVVFGPRTVIEAVADGHKAARAIDNYLKAGRRKLVRRGWMTKVSFDELPSPDYYQKPRINPPKITLDRRTGVSEVEMVFDEPSAREQSQRCLRCHIQTVFNSSLCIVCGGCIDVCPRNCLKLVPVEKVTGNDAVNDLISARCGTPSGESQSTGTAMIKDETRCIRCGLCARRCPVGAITMEAFSFEEQLVYEGGTA
ncbi:MAG: FAD-dependent oxidoreductase, partial [Dehalococcoidales bacterium]|nr:FAD-dependent oxidoreductase [Dehalococcoidales bacterium]